MENKSKDKLKELQELEKIKCLAKMKLTKRKNSINTWLILPIGT